MAETLIVLQCAALVALILLALSATRWFWKSTPCYRRHGLADIQPKGRQEPESEESCYVVVRPGSQKKKVEKKAGLRP